MLILNIELTNEEIHVTDSKNTLLGSIELKNINDIKKRGSKDESECEEQKNIGKKIIKSRQVTPGKKSDKNIKNKDKISKKGEKKSKSMSGSRSKNKSGSMSKNKSGSRSKSMRQNKRKNLNPNFNLNPILNVSTKKNKMNKKK